MFQVGKEHFGPVEAVKIRHPKSGQKLQLLQGLGASLNELVLCNPQGKADAVLLGYDSGREAIEQMGTTYRGTFLFPFPNRLADGAYQVNGKEYRLPQNDGGNRPNALHGLLFDKSFELVSQEETEQFGQVLLRFEAQAGQFEAYPFPFRIELTHTLDVKDGYACKICITNTGSEAIPFGTGYHPYLRVQDSEHFTLHLPAVERTLLDANMIPTGVTENFDRFAAYAKVTESLDDGFILTEPSSRQETCIMDTAAGHTLVMWQHAGPVAFNYLQVYTSLDMLSLAIEPMSCIANAFQTGEGLITLAPGASAEFHWGILLR